MTALRSTAVFCSAIFAVLLSGCLSEKIPAPEEIERTAGERIHVLCLASEDTKIQGLDSIQPEVVREYRDQGYELHFAYYQKVNPEELGKYPVVVGMIPQLFCGTKAIDGKLGDAIEKYVAGGGGFLLMSEPSYYGVEDFLKQMNPWLRRFDVQLLNDQPRDSDPENRKEMVRVLTYRFLKTSNMSKHPVTEGVDFLWLPTHFSDSYVLTYTMKAGPAWDVIVRGEKTCAGYKFNELRDGNRIVGEYPSEPPLLAVRDFGKGKLAVFSTASGYFIWDALHWGNGSGFVLHEGNGMKLMCNLFKYLSSGEKYLAESRNPGGLKLPPPPIREKRNAVTGNVPIMPGKKEWLGHVVSKIAPENSSVKYYVDCGALSDIPYAPERGYGYLDTPGASWCIRWPWSEIFHATASNSRAFDIKTLQYRFDKLDPQKKYSLGVMVWGYQPEGAKNVVIASPGGQSFRQNIPLPLYAEKEGPKFELFEIPRDIIRDNSMTLSFSCGKEGQGTFSSVCELWVFENDSAGTRNAGEIISAFESPSECPDKLKPATKPYKGLIGAKSEFSGEGKSTVAEMAKAAQNSGLSFLVFTDKLENLDGAKVAGLKEECGKASNEKFTAMPGFEFSAKYSDMKHDYQDPKSRGDVNAYVFNNIEKLPGAKSFSNPYELFWKFFGGELGGGKSNQPTLLTPGKNGISPFFQRFWRGFNVVTFDENLKESDNSKETYADLLSSGYGPFPRVSGVFTTPSEIENAATGWKTIFCAPNFREMPLCHYSSMITNGPELANFTMSFDHYRELDWGGGLNFRGDTRLAMNFHVKSPSKIKEITLYGGNKIARKWHPESGTFETAESILVAANHEFWMNIITENGGELVTGRIQAVDSDFPVGMCSDNQNTICSLTVPPSRFERDERELYYQHSYWHTGEAAGQLGILKDARNLVPRIIETGIIQPVKYFLPAPLLRFSSGATENHVYSELRIKEGSGDFNIIEYRFDSPEGKASSKVSLTSFRPSRGGGTAVLVETDIAAVENLVFDPVNSVQLLSIGMMPSLPKLWNYTCRTRDREIRSGKFTEIPDGKSIEIPLDAEGGIMLWPSDAGNLFIFPLSSGMKLNVSFDNAGAWNVRERVRLFASIPGLEKGGHVVSKILVVLYSGGIDSGDQLAGMRRLYADFSSAVKDVLSGKLLDTSYPVRFSADANGSIVAAFDTSGNYDPMPVLVEGVSDNCSAGIVENGDVVKILEPSGTVLRTVVPPGKSGSEIFIGSLFVCESRSILLEWGGIHAGGVRFHAHNPLPDKVITAVSGNPESGLPAFRTEISLESGESRWIWAKDDLAVVEGASMQIDKFSGEENIAEITCHGKGPFRFSGTWKAIEANGGGIESDSKEISCGNENIKSVKLIRK